MLRIGICGSHGVGKSTVVAELQRRWSADGFRCLAAPEAGGPIVDELSTLDPHHRTLRMIQEHFRRLRTREADICLLDRTLLDFYTYFQCESKPDPIVDQLMHEMLRWYRHILDLCFYIPIEFAMTADGRRPISEPYRRKIDQLLREKAAELEITLIPLTGSIGERAHMATSYLYAKTHRQAA